MIFVLDTNVVVSGLLWNGPPARLIDAAIAGRIELATSVVLLAELAGVLRREKFAATLVAGGIQIDDFVLGYAALATRVNPAPIPPTVAADPADDHVLACALAARADLIVSGDRHLLALESFRNIPIVAAADALALVPA